MGKKILLLQKDVISRFKNIHGEKFDYSHVKYTGMFNKVIIKCNVCNSFFDQNPNNHIHNKRGCPYCGEKARRTNNTYTTKEFIEIAKNTKQHEDKGYVYNKTIYTGIKNRIIITCPKIGHGDFYQIADKHINEGCGCPTCGVESRVNNSRLTIDEIIKTATLIHGDRYDYSLLYTVSYENTYTKFPIFCKHCNIIFFKSVYNHIYCETGCNTCYGNKSSYGEDKINQFLLNATISFVTEKRFKECKNINQLPFDFYLPNYNACIEFDGRQHFESVKFFGGEEEFVLTQKRDNIKTQYCKDNNIPLLRIKYNENVEEKLNEFLETLLAPVAVSI